MCQNSLGSLKRWSFLHGPKHPPLAILYTATPPPLPPSCQLLWETAEPIVDAGLMCPRPMCPRPKILGCCAPGTKRPLDIVSLTDVSRPWTASSMELAPSAAIVALVGLRRLMDQWGVWPASPTPLTRFIGLAPLRRMHARPTHRIKSKGWDGSVRGKIPKGHFVQGMQHPRIFGRGHISSLGRYVFGSEISYNKAPPRLPGLGC
jgi:hypothetical protein